MYSIIIVFYATITLAKNIPVNTSGECINTINNLFLGIIIEPPIVHKCLNTATYREATHRGQEFSSSSAGGKEGSVMLASKLCPYISSRCNVDLAYTFPVLWQLPRPQSPSPAIFLPRIFRSFFFLAFVSSPVFFFFLFLRLRFPKKNQGVRTKTKVVVLSNLTTLPLPDMSGTPRRVITRLGKELLQRVLSNLFHGLR